MSAVPKHNLSDRLLTERELADLTGFSRSKIQKDRLFGKGPKCCRIGRAVRYKLSDVEKWLASLGPSATAK